MSISSQEIVGAVVEAVSALLDRIATLEAAVVRLYVIADKIGDDEARRLTEENYRAAQAIKDNLRNRAS